MRFFPEDFWVLFIGAAVITTFSILFYLEFTSKIDVGNAKKIGYIQHKRKVAQRKYASQVIWEDVEEKFPIYNNDTIRTAEQAEAVVHLNDGTEVELRQNSMIMLSLNEENVNIDFSHGSMATKRASGKTKGKLRINSGEASIEAGAGALSLAKQGKKDLDVSVESGVASIAAGGKVASLNSNQKAVIAGTELEKYNLTLKQLTPGPDVYILISSQKKGVTFSWQAPPTKQKVTLQISRDVSFNTPFISRKLIKNKITLKLPSGMFFWRLMAIDRKTKKNIYSTNRSFTIVKDRKLALLSPANKSAIIYRSKLPLVIFKWAKSEVASRYKLIISKNKDMQNPINNVLLKKNIFGTDTLQQGVYYWQVVADASLPGLEHSQKSLISKFEITRKDEVIPPVLLLPAEYRKISNLFIGKKPVLFTWKKDNEVKECKIEISSDENFRNIYHKQIIKYNFLELKKKLAVGNYYWRVVGILSDKSQTRYSKTRKFSVINTSDIALYVPKNNKIIYPKGFEKDPSIAFSWQKVFEGASYKLQLSRDKSFLKIEKDLKTKVNYNIIPSIKSGRYYWRVSLYDEKDKVILTSKTYNFEVAEVLLAPIGLYPVRGKAVNLRGKKELLLKWKKDSNVDYYNVALYSIEKGKPNYILSKQITNDQCSITEFEKLDEGNFMWTVQAFTKKGTLRKSRVIKNYFSITLGGKLKKPKLTSPSVIYFE